MFVSVATLHCDYQVHEVGVSVNWWGVCVVQAGCWHVWCVCYMQLVCSVPSCPILLTLWCLCWTRRRAALLCRSSKGWVPEVSINKVHIWTLTRSLDPHLEGLCSELGSSTASWLYSWMCLSHWRVRTVHLSPSPPVTLTALSSWDREFPVLQS